MMANRSDRRAAIKQPGFYIHGRDVFSSVGAANCIYDALMGDALVGIKGQNDIATRFRRVNDTLIGLFSAVMQNSHIFIALRDYPAAWESVGLDWRAYTPLPVHLVRETVVVFTQARREYRGNAARTPLTELVDAWVRVEDRIQAMGPTTKLFLPLRPAAGYSEAGFIHEVQAAQIARPSASAPAMWPPAHFHAKDLSFLANSRVSGPLNGITTTNQGAEPSHPSRFSTPWELRVWLCRIALVSTTAETPKLVYMTPVGFMNNAARQDWYEVTGAQSKALGTVDGFLEYTTDAMMSRSKTTVMGLFTNWFLQKYQVEWLADVTNSDLEEVWTKQPRMARVGVALVLRMIVRNEQRGVQVISFDPSVNYDLPKRQISGNQHAFFQYKAALKYKIEQWAQGLGVPILERWWAGTHWGFRQDKEGDSVELAADFCRRWMEDGDLPEDEGKLRQLGFQKTEF